MEKCRSFWIKLTTITLKPESEDISKHEGQSIQRGIAILRVCIPLAASFPLIGSDNFEADGIPCLI